MTDATDPLTPPDCDLRDYPWMPLDVRRLLTSETWVLGTPEQKIAALTLWCESWCQVPAGSLSSDDRMLAHLSGAGAAWKKVRDHVMRGWVKCSDGRVYHPVVCEKARESWERKLAQKARTEAARAAKASRKVAPTDAPPSTPQVDPTSSVTEPATTSVTDIAAAAVGVQSQPLPQAPPNLTRTEQTLKEELPSVVARDANGVRASAHGTRLPDDWTPGDDGFRFAEEQGLDPNRVLASFRDYWVAKPGKDGRKADWTATWRGWCRRDAERRGSSQRPAAAGRFDAWDRLAEHAEATIHRGGRA